MNCSSSGVSHIVSLNCSSSGLCHCVSLNCSSSGLCRASQTLDRLGREEREQFQQIGPSKLIGRTNCGISGTAFRGTTFKVFKTLKQIVTFLLQLSGEQLLRYSKILIVPIVFYVGPPKERIFFTTIYGLYFSHHYTHYIFFMI